MDGRQAPATFILNIFLYNHVSTSQILSFIFKLIPENQPIQGKGYIINKI